MTFWRCWRSRPALGVWDCGMCDFGGQFGVAGTLWEKEFYTNNRICR